MNLVLMFLISKKDNFQLWFLYKSDLRISTAGKYMGIIRKKLLRVEKRKYLTHY